MRIIALTALAAVGLTVPASAAAIDQDNLFALADPADSFLTSGVGRSNWTSQSFTAGVTGTLTRLDLQLARFGEDPLRITIGAGQVIDSDYSVLFTLDVPNADVPGSLDSLFSVDLSGVGQHLTAGNVYSITLQSAVGGFSNQFGWVIGAVTPAGGEYYNVDSNGTTWGTSDAGETWTVRGVARPFRTWMEADVAGIPEPASWALMIAGFGAVGVAARRRRPVAA